MPMVKKTYKGSITIFLSMILMVLFTLIGLLIESSRIAAIKVRSKEVTYISSDSAFAQFLNPLLNEYGILGLWSSEENLASECKKRIRDNLDEAALFNEFELFGIGLNGVCVSNITYITDNDGEVFSDAINDYMKYAVIGRVVEYTNEVIGMRSNTGTSENSMDFQKVKEIERNKTEIEQAQEIIEGFEQENEKENTLNSGNGDNENNTENWSVSEAKEIKDTIFDKISEILKNGLLALIVKEPQKVSKSIIEKTILPSKTVQLSAEGTKSVEEKRISNGGTKKLAVVSYITSKFGNYLESKEDSLLKYEMEYIVGGSDEDSLNLLNTAISIISIRSGFNMISIMKDSSKIKEAEKLAELTTDMIPIPGIKYVVEYIIVQAWGTAEAVIDVRDLLEGKKVNLIKSNAEWTLSLKGIISLGKNTPSSNKGEKGLSYTDYINTVLYMQNDISTYYRTMDLIQMNICDKYNNGFRMNSVIRKASIEAEYNANQGYSRLYRITGNYKYTIEQTQAY